MELEQLAVNLCSYWNGNERVRRRYWDSDIKPNEVKLAEAYLSLLYNYNKIRSKLSHDRRN